MAKKPTTKQETTKKIEPAPKTVTAKMKHIDTLSDEKASAMLGEMYEKIKTDHCTNAELVEFILGKVNTDPEWRAWAALQLFWKVVVR